MIKHHLLMMCKMLSSMVAEGKLQLNAAELQIHKSATESLDAPADNDCPDCSEGSLSRVRLEGAAESAKMELLRLRGKIAEEEDFQNSDVESIDRIVTELGEQLYEKSEEEED